MTATEEHPTNLRALLYWGGVSLVGFLFISVMLAFLISNGSLSMVFQDIECRLGKGISCHNLAVEYHLGTHVKKDRNREIALRKRACSLGNSDNCRWLSFIYAEGTGVVRNSSLAIRYAERACSLKDKIGCWFAGHCFSPDSSSFFRKFHDSKKAIHYYRKACQLGNADACESLRRMKDRAMKVRFTPG